MHYSGDPGLPTWPPHAGPHSALWDGHHCCRDLRWAPTWVWLPRESFKLIPFPCLKSSMWQFTEPHVSVTSSPEMGEGALEGLPLHPDMGWMGGAGEGQGPVGTPLLC